VDYLGRGRNPEYGLLAGDGLRERPGPARREAYARVVSVMCELFFDSNIRLVVDVCTVINGAGYDRTSRVKQGPA